MEKIKINVKPLLERRDDIIDFTKIMGRVTKKELNRVLRDDKVYVGGEFEFYHNGIKDTAQSSERLEEAYEEAKTAYNKYYDDVNHWNKGLSYTIDEKDDRLYEINEMLEDGSNILEESKKDKLNTEKKEVEKFLEEPHKAYTDQRGALPNVPPEINTYIEYLNEWVDNYEKFNEYYDTAEEIPSLPAYDEYDDYDPIDWVSQAKKALKDHDFPFAYKITKEGGTTLKVGDTDWSIQDDGSLGDTGMEAISPPMPLEDFFGAMDKMFAYISENGSTNSKTGFHIHMSLKNTPNLKAVLDPFKLMLFSEEDKIWKYFETRKDNNYVLSIKQGKLFREKDTQDPETSEEIFNVSKIKDKIMSNPLHYDAINLSGLDASHGHVEFRYLGGADYHTKSDRIKQIILSYAYILEMSCNPEFRKKEYVKKYNKVLLRAEFLFMHIRTLVTEALLRHYNTAIDNGATPSPKDEKRLKNKIRALRRQRDGYYKYFKDPHEINLAAKDSKSFKQKLIVEISKEFPSFKKVKQGKINILDIWKERLVGTKN